MHTMCYRHLHLALLAAWATILASPSARAWVETSIRSHTATVDLERDGHAVVSHELVVKVRGGPLKSIRVDGVDDDAKLETDATVARVRSDRKLRWPLLLHKGDDSAVTLEVDDDKGLRSGVYRFQFSYRSNFVGRDLLQQRGGLVFLTWAGPRLDDGVDSVKAIFRLPRGDTAPRLPSRSDADQATELEVGGLLVSQLRRGPEKDELELVRTHVAKGEPAVWRLQASARSFDAFTAPKTPVAPRQVAEGSVPAGLRGSWLLVALLVALAYAGVTALKSHVGRKALGRKNAQARSLVPLPGALRAALAGVSLSGALLAALSLSYPTLAGVLLVISMLLATELPPRLNPTMRGPGSWERLPDERAFRVPDAKPAGRWLDTGSVPGFVLFSLCLLAFAALALLLLPSGPYYAAVAALGSACLFPIFCTGRAGELPPDPVARPCRVFGPLARQLRKEFGWTVTPLARVPHGQQEPDELRLLIEPDGMPQGHLALELALEYQVGSGVAVDLPCLIVRARDDSPAYYALPRSVVWSRGRSSSERVALLRPKLPTRALCARLTREVVSTLQVAAQGRLRQPQRAASHSSAMSAGSRLVTSKFATSAASQRI